MRKMIVAKKMMKVLSCLVAKFMLVSTNKATSADYMDIHVAGVVA